MSQNRQYELVYIVSPDASEQDVADLHTQVEQIIQRFNGTPQVCLRSLGRATRRNSSHAASAVAPRAPTQ